jgi:DNA-binding beta-propeller fold protein YncE
MVHMTHHIKRAAARFVLGAMVLAVVVSPPAGAFALPVHHAVVAPAATARAGFGSALAGTAPAGNGPSLLAADPATHTVYVANGENNNGPSAGGDTVSVIDTRHCKALNVSRCKGPWPTITVGNGTPGDLPSGIAIDQKTDTVYVTNVGDDTVSVFNGATCNAIRRSGCGQRPAEVPVGSQPLNLYADPANHTVYVVNLGATTLSMIDSATCNARHLSACPQTKRPTLNVGVQPLAVDVNLVTHTVYVTTFGTGSQNGWAVFNASTCNAVKRSGCHFIGRLIGSPTGPNDGQVDTANDTLYTADFANTVSVFNLHRCWAGDLAGCAADKPGIVTPFPDPDFQEETLNVAVDQPLHSVYVSLTKDDALAVIDTSVCNGRHLAACATLRTPSIHTGAAPQGVVLDRRTQTLYVANEAGNDVSVIDARSCNARTTSGCRHPAPALAVPAQAVGFPGTGAPVAYPAAHTAYVPSGTREVSMISTSRCAARRPAGCADAPRHVIVGHNPVQVAVNRRTETVYVANAGAGSAGTVTVINPATCNSTVRTGCASLAALRVPAGNPSDIAVDAATNTIYVATVAASGPNIISVFNGATCDAADKHGCGQAPSLLHVADSGGGNSSLSIAVNQRTNTLYVTNVVYASQTSDTVYVINGATCDAATAAGCGQTPATVTVGQDPRGLAVDERTDTVYVVNHEQGDFPGTISVISGATCNGQDTGGCSQTTATVRAGFGAAGVAVDPRTGTIYVTNDEDSSVSVIDGATCNGQHTSGCGQIPAKRAVGNYPNAIGVDPAAGTAYVANLDNTVSVIPLSR